MNCHDCHLNVQLHTISKPHRHKSSQHDIATGANVAIVFIFRHYKQSCIKYSSSTSKHQYQYQYQWFKYQYKGYD